MTQCIHELAVEACFYCKPKVEGAYWDAKFDGTCSTCHQPIVVGQRVKWNAEGTYTVHATHKGV